MGASKGFPDLLILDPPPVFICDDGGPCGIDLGACVDCANDGRWERPGVALELKRVVRNARPSPEQVEHLERLAARGWLVTVQWGCEAALEYLRGKGYTV
jgi:hypothetical protein